MILHFSYPENRQRPQLKMSCKDLFTSVIRAAIDCGRMDYWFRIAAIEKIWKGWGITGECREAELGSRLEARGEQLGISGEWAGRLVTDKTEKSTGSIWVCGWQKLWSREHWLTFQKQATCFRQGNWEKNKDTGLEAGTEKQTLDWVSQDTTIVDIMNWHITTARPCP